MVLNGFFVSAVVLLLVGSKSLNEYLTRWHSIGDLCVSPCAERGMILGNGFSSKIHGCVFSLTNPFEHNKDAWRNGKSSLGGVDYVSNNFLLSDQDVVGRCFL